MEIRKHEKLNTVIGSVGRQSYASKKEFWGVSLTTTSILQPTNIAAEDISLLLRVTARHLVHISSLNVW